MLFYIIEYVQCWWKIGFWSIAINFKICHLQINYQKKDLYRIVNIIIAAFQELSRYTWQNTNLELICKYIYIILYLCKQIIVSVDYMQSDILVCNNNKSHIFAEYDTSKYANAFNCKFFHGFLCIVLSIFSP